MIIIAKDPAVMDMQDRLSEIASLLARAYLRLISRNESGNCLDDSAADEAPCVSGVNGEENGESVEVA